MKRALPILATVMSFALAAASPVDPVNRNRNGIAISGFDPVAYFVQSKPVQGSSQFAYSWMGAAWWFASPQDRDLFAANPEKYAPQFGGYCAWAVSNGYTADVDPEAWKIIDGKLYLNYSKSIQRKWEQDVVKRIDDANRNWPGLSRQGAAK